MWFRGPFSKSDNLPYFFSPFFHHGMVGQVRLVWVYPYIVALLSLNIVCCSLSASEGRLLPGFSSVWTGDVLQSSVWSIFASKTEQLWFSRVFRYFWDGIQSQLFWSSHWKIWKKVLIWDSLAYKSTRSADMFSSQRRKLFFPAAWSHPKMCISN